MNMNLDINIASIIFLILIIPVSLLAEGIKRKIIARMQNRKGPPIWQVFYDVSKLFRKGKSNTLASKNAFFVITPLLYFLTTLVLFLFIPLSIISFGYDFIFLIYVLVLNSALYVVMGLSSNNPFAIIGSMRELALMVCYEMIIVVTVATVFVFDRIISLYDFGTEFLILKLPIAAICLFYAILVETRITPYDTIEAETEVLEGVKSEYSGAGLAFMELSRDLKLVFFSMLFAYLFIGSVNIWLLFAATALMIPFLAFTKATTCRYRMDQTLKIFIIVLLLSIVELVRINFIRW